MVCVNLGNHGAALASKVMPYERLMAKKMAQLFRHCDLKLIDAIVFNVVVSLNSHVLCLN